ncbi:MAG: cobalamin B12-binding domain-containing protein, partial [Massilia sp.]|nr:cobalamin B12-binding domain-containing protein [Massilia sp.]
MNDSASAAKLHLPVNLPVNVPEHPTLANKVRFVTAASLFDGHDASINIMRRILQSNGVEVVHLGHNRSVDEVVTAALTEDVQGIAISSYQGGHVEYFKYMIDLLRARGGAHIKVFGGGGGVIVAEEIAELHAYGVSRIFSPEDGQRMGLVGMIRSMIDACDFDLSNYAPTSLAPLQTGAMEARHRPLAQLITALENQRASNELRCALGAAAAATAVPTLGITGTGGAGKSSLSDELVRRLRLDQGDALNIAIISIDPSRRKSGGALLGDRIRMNAINPWNGQARVFMRSLATREAGSEISHALPDVIAACKVAGFDLVIVETSGIGQGDAAIVSHVDLSMYVMTPEFGAASQLEKIDMLDFADFIAINKFDRKGAQDALRDVAKQYQRNRELWSVAPEQMPVFGTQASRFNDDGVTALYQGLLPKLAEHGLPIATGPGKLAPVAHKQSSGKHVIVPASRARYLADIADSVRAYHANTRKQVKLARERQQLQETKRMLLAAGKAAGTMADSVADTTRNTTGDTMADTMGSIDQLISEREQALDASAKKLLAMWPDMQAAYAGDDYVVKIRGQEIRTRLVQHTLSGSVIRKVVLPKYVEHGEVLKFLMLENVPGAFPFTAGVFAFKRENEDPTRMFAGEGDAFRTNRRFKLVSAGMDAKRLSTAFDSVTLYGADPALRPDIYGKVGNSGVS